MSYIESAVVCVSNILFTCLGLRSHARKSPVWVTTMMLADATTQFKLHSLRPKDSFEYAEKDVRVEGFFTFGRLCWG